MSDRPDPPSRAEERRTDLPRRDGPASRQPDRRLDPDRDGVRLAGHRLPAEQRDLPRDLPILQGTTLVLAFFMMLNLTVDVIQTMVDPRIKRG